MRTLVDGLYVCLPSNIIELVKENYLVKLYYKSLLMRNAKFIQSNKEFVSTLEISNILSALHGFGVVLLGKLKAYNKELKGQFKAGLYCALKANLSFKKDVDMRIFKFSQALTPNELFIGSAWGNRYPVEKAMLDNLIYIIHREDLDYSTLHSYILKQEEIERLYGINRKLHINKVISLDEQKFIEANYEIPLTKVTSTYFDTYQELISVQKSLLAHSKELRKYKEVAQSLIDSRVKLVYSKLSKQQKKKKAPIEVLIQPLKGTIDYVNTFNPCRAVGLPLTFRVGEYPQNQGNLIAIQNDLRKFLDKYIAKIDEIRADYVYGWYTSELGGNL